MPPSASTREAHQRLPKPVPEKRRDRDVYRYYGPALRDVHPLPRLPSSPDNSSLPSDYVPQPAKDSALMAFCQLAALRLRARRALISLIDGQHQYILAEATPEMSLRYNSTTQNSKDLWLGNVSIPRAWGVCENVVALGSEAFDPSKESSAAVIINDLLADEKFSKLTYIKETPCHRFYAGFPLISPSNSVVGSLCVFDHQPREGLSSADVAYMRDLALTVVEHLEVYTTKDGYKRGEQLIRGLISFAEGDSALKPYDNHEQDLSSISRSRVTSAITEQEKPAETDSQVQPPVPNVTYKGKALHGRDSDGVEFAANLEETGLRSLPQSPSPLSRSSDDVAMLQNNILPVNSKVMFARAANVLRASSDLDGVLILDASVAATGSRRYGNETMRSSDSGPEGASDARSTSSEGEGLGLLAPSGHEGPRSASRRSEKGSSKACHVLGVSTLETDATGDATYAERKSFLENDLKRMLELFPDGKVFSFTAEGDAILSTDESDSATTSVGESDISATQGDKHPKRRMDRLSKCMNALQRLAPGARSAAFVPFWDYERSRWFAGCLCWSRRAHRPISEQVDLMYFKVFGHTTMTELSRLDALALNRTKSTFIASISHELRSPLHGILGTLEFINGTSLDSFQATMFNAMAACSQTLLDTLDHLLDYAKISESKQTSSTTRLKGPNTVHLSTRRDKHRRSSGMSGVAATFDLSVATEEVIEAVFAGRSYRGTSVNMDEEELYAPANGPDAVLQSQSQSLQYQEERKNVLVVLDIPDHQDWIHCVPVGAWRRIVMNLFSNALRYTEIGYIKVSLRTGRSARPDTETHIVLTISDSGIGMNPDFLANRMFRPFAQENPLSTGAGLGLSIIRQIIETIGGKIEISSELGKGTEAVVKLTLPKAQNLRIAAPLQDAARLSAMHLAGRKICILREEHPKNATSSIPGHREAMDAFIQSLDQTLRTWLGLNVIHSNQWEGHGADLVICTEPSFGYLSSIRARRAENHKAPITIFVAMDALEATTLLSDVRVKSKESVVEVITQPCGPHKLRKLLAHCVNRYESSDKNIPTQSSESPTSVVNAEQNGSQVPPDNVNTVAWQSTVAVGLHSKDKHTGTPPLTRKNINESRILIVDDNPINRKLLSTLMKKERLNYHEASNGHEALQAYQIDPLNFNTILMDISMPVMDGMTATRAIRKYEQDQKLRKATVIALTGLTSASARFEAWRSGIDHFMTKPVNFQALVSYLQPREEQNPELSSPQTPSSPCRINPPIQTLHPSSP